MYIVEETTEVYGSLFRGAIYDDILYYNIYDSSFITEVFIDRIVLLMTSYRCHLCGLGSARQHHLQYVLEHCCQRDSFAEESGLDRTFLTVDASLIGGRRAGLSAEKNGCCCGN